MTHTTKQILVAVAGAAVVSLGIYKVSTYKDPVFNKIKIDYSNTVVNQTTKPYLDTIVHTGLSVMGLSDIAVIIKPMDSEVQRNFEDGTNLEAFIRVQDGIYNIYLDNISKEEAITVLAHELVHLKQYDSKTLILKDVSIPIWKGRTFDLSTVTYDNRPWEIEAFGKQAIIANKIKAVLY
jgi:hypothetical protein